MTPVLALVCTMLAGDAPATPTPSPAERAALLPVVVDGVEAPLDLPVVLARPRPALVIEPSSCAGIDCPEEARRGASAFVQVRLRRVADEVIISMTLLEANGTVVASAVELVGVGTPAALSAGCEAAVDRLAQRAGTERRRQRDGDADGVPNEADECPDVAGVAATGGCPDRDGDAVADARDRCPGEAGTVETEGCRPVVAIAPEPPPETEPQGIEWGRVIGGGAGSFLGAAVGAGAGIGVAYLIRTSVAAQTPGLEFMDEATIGSYAAGAGLGTLIGALAPDVTCAGLCSYPLAASGWTRALSVSSATLAAAGGSAIGTLGLLRGDNQLALAGAILLGAAPVLAGAETSIGNCISGPPTPATP
jgi:hypothetical protein